MSHGYTHCPGNQDNLCVHARKCPYHGDAIACAEDVGLSQKQKAQRRQERKAAHQCREVMRDYFAFRTVAE